MKRYGKVQHKLKSFAQSLVVREKAGHENRHQDDNCEQNTSTNPTRNGNGGLRTAVHYDNVEAENSIFVAEVDKYSSKCCYFYSNNKKSASRKLNSYFFFTF